MPGEFWYNRYINFVINMFMLSRTKSPSIYILLVLLVLLIAWTGYKFIQSSDEVDPVQTLEESGRTHLILDGYTPPTGPPPTDQEWEEIFSDKPNPDTKSKELSTEDREDRLAQLVSEIKSIISLEATAVGQCKLVAMGHAPCGGPGYYLPYAVANTDEVKLEDLASQHRELSQAQNAQSGIMGICVITLEPELIIADGQCTVKSE